MEYDKEKWSGVSTCLWDGHTAVYHSQRNKITRDINQNTNTHIQISTHTVRRDCTWMLCFDIAYLASHKLQGQHLRICRLCGNTVMSHGRPVVWNQQTTRLFVGHLVQVDNEGNRQRSASLVLCYWHPQGTGGFLSESDSVSCTFNVYFRLIERPLT